MQLSREFYSFMPESANKAVLPEDLHKFDESTFLIEEKYDGSMYAARIIPGSSNYPHLSKVSFTSRRLSAKDGKPVEKSDNLLHICLAPSALEGTLLLGEIVSSSGFSNTAAIMNSKPEKAIARQRETAWLRYIVFDCLWDRGTDIRRSSFEVRRRAALAAVSQWHDFLEERKLPLRPLVNMSPAVTGGEHSLVFTDLLSMYNGVVKQGGEGLMIKNRRSPYGEGLFKCKKHFDVSVIITNYIPGQGKYEGQVGAIVFSVVGEKGALYEIGQCGGMTDDMRLQMTNRFTGSYMNQVMDVRCQPPDDPSSFVVGKTRLRHPRFLRMRPDLSASQCTAEKLLRDFKTTSK